MSNGGYLELSGNVVYDIEAYLLAHEGDIYYGINDFGKLLHVFHVIMGRAPMEMRDTPTPQKDAG